MASDILAKPQLLRQIAAHIFAEDSEDSITLVGTVATEEEREGTACFVAALEPGRRLVNHLDVDSELQTPSSLSFLEPELEEDEEELAVDDTYCPYFPPTDPVIARTETAV